MLTTVHEADHLDFTHLMWNSHFVTFNLKRNIFGLIKTLNILGIQSPCHNKLATK